LRVKEDGKSESRAVMGRIGVERKQHHPTRKRADFHQVFHHEITWQTDIRRKTQMTVTKTAKAVKVAGAASPGEVEWQAIDWQKAHHNVRRLQARIVKAMQAGRWGKVKALQYLLTHSFSAKALAVKRVTENKGKRTPGVDGEIWNTPSKKAAAIGKLRRRGYRPQPLRRIYIPKRDGIRKRPLSIPVMKDRAMQALHLLALDPIAECIADPNSYAYRKERCQADAIEQCHTILCRKNSAEWVYEGDIAACFDRISHKWLIENIPMDKRVLTKWLKAGYIEKYVLHPTEEGVPQGGIISPVIANLALDGLERELGKRYPKAKVNLVRFADDFVITGRTKELLEKEIAPVVKEYVKERGLEISPGKTCITHIDEGFDFLGQNIRKYKGKLLIKPSRKNVKAFLTKIRQIIKTSGALSAGQLIVRLNPILKGWANYHRHSASKQTFSKVEQAIFRAIWQWAKRRHPNKPHKWIKKKYFKSIGNRQWVFSGKIEGKGGKLRPIHLINVAAVAIKRYTKIKGAANPYDPEWESYYEERLGQKMAEDLKGRRQLLYLWQEQEGICPVCKQKITKQTGWHNHHIVWRAKGGSDKAENRILLHPNCHRQVHSQKLEVAKPRLSAGVRKA
jgi:RNA-directed DNA polymerase